MPIRPDLHAVLVRLRPSVCAMGLVALGIAGACSAHADAKSALPAADANFKLTGPIQIFTPANLETHIDGEAEAIGRYEFRQCAYGQYAPGGKGNQLMTVDVYQLGTPQDAYGYYAHQRSATAHIVNIGAEGYQEPDALNFWKGPYYVRIAITAANKAAFQPEMPKLARVIAGKLSGPTTRPAIMDLLPPGYAPHTDEYQPREVAAQSYIVNAAEARYPSAGPQAELFVAVFPSPAAAKQAYTKYQTYLSTPLNVAVGAKPTPLKGVGDSAVEVRTKFTGQVVAAEKGKYLIAVRKAKDPKSAEAIVKSAIARAK